MESKYKLTMCRLCLCENQSFFNIFNLNDWHGFIAAEVISNLLRCKVSETDGYPHVVCSKCLVKLTDFKLFKECCQKSKVKYDNMFVSRKNLEENKPELDIGDVGSGLELCEQDPLRETSPDVTIKSEEVIIDSSSYEVSEDPLIETEVTIKSEKVIIDSSSYEVSEDPLMETEVRCGPILLKYEVLPFSRDSHPQEEIIDSDVSGNEEIVESTAALMQDSPQPTLLETVIYPNHQQCLQYKRSQCTSKGEIDADSCLSSISTNDKSKINSLSEDVATSSGTIETLEGQSISQGESLYMASFFHQGINTGKEVKKNRKMEEGIDEEGEGWRGTGTKKGANQRREELECFHCGIVLFSKFSLIKHMKVHGVVNSYDCATCGKVFHFNWHLKRHVMMHTGSRPYKCAECGKCFSQKDHLNRHMSIHTYSKPYKCAECSKCFSQKSDLNRHMSRHTGSKPYKCAECSKCFCEKCDLLVHMRLHTGSKPYKCSICGKCFRQRGNLNKHMRIHTGSKPYKCAECGKCFSQKDHLNRHMSIHTNSKPYKCADCSKCFSQKSDLNRHMSIHTGSKPYKCADCGKCFCEECDLIVHMRTHTGSKPYKCNECSKYFSQHGSLNCHMRKHTRSKAI